MRACILIIFCSLLAIGAGILILWWRQDQLQKNLIGGLTGLNYREILSRPRTDRDYTVFGFLPYWTMNTAEVPSAVTDVAYFSVIFDGQGRLVEQLEGGSEAGYARLRSETFTNWAAQQPANRKIHITVVGNGNDEIAELVSSPVARQNFRQNITQLLASYPFSGVQLDFEYSATATDDLRANYVLLVKDLNQDVKKMDPNMKVSVAAFGSAASKQSFWDIAGLAPHIDYLIIMSYDYHVRSSQVAGPVAPLFGKETGRWQDDITSNLRDFMQQIPPEKILLGIPFYGYEWQISGEEPGSPTFPSSGATATYQRVQALLAERGDEIEEGWDSAALSPYIFYQQDGENRLIYYDNPRSLSYKLDLVEQLNFGGVAIWALGYEGEQSELWQVIEAKFDL